MSNRTNTTNRQEIAAQALANAVTGQSTMNYGSIYAEFTDRGIPPADIKPRENVFTYHAWRALGRQVKRGEHGVKVVTFVPMTKKQADGSEEAFRAPRSTTVFHVSQTDEVPQA
jgi:hypothetical protein